VTGLAATLPGRSLAAEKAVCAHCGEQAPAGERFCCTGCAAAFDVVQALGLGNYYQRRVIDRDARPLRPRTEDRVDLARHVAARADGGQELTLAVDGVQCGACVWLIESLLSRDPVVSRARVNLTTRRLHLVWKGAAEDAARLVGQVEALGYRLIPFEPGALARARSAADQKLLRALAAAGFAAGNVMLMSIGVWSGLAESMGPATRGLLHWVSALIAMPAIAYAGMPFFTSAWAALRSGRTNMDVPVSVGVVLVTAMSLAETMQGGQHTYFDSATALLFFLLIGRVLDARARGVARETAEQLLALRGGDVTVLGADGSARKAAAENVAPGARVLVGMGERVGVDGVVTSGDGSLDVSLVSGESLPVAAHPGTQVFAGTLNLGGPLTLRVTAAGGATLLAECARLIAAAESRRGRFVILADRVARVYAPAVHALALLTFLGWVFGMGLAWNQALLIAASVLIITCPCALALAVPAVQVIATARLYKSGILLKSATALERLAAVDTVVFDKTGTLTQPELGLAGISDPAALAVAAGLAAVSRHPLARALVAAAGSVMASSGVVEHPGRGLSLAGPSGETRLGSADFCGVDAPAAEGPEMWLVRPGHAPYRFAFAEAMRPDAVESIARLRGLGLDVRILSGDRAAAVGVVAQTLGVAHWQAGLTPPGKVAVLEALAGEGRKVLMVGDGLNDGPALAAASVSASPASAADISQNAADVVFQGGLLAPVGVMIGTARRAARVMRQNLLLSLAYNVLMVPVAIIGWVTPWLAAAAMSGSSLVVIGNSFRLRRRGSA